jgi:LPS sulfotransferase NodH
MTDNYLILSAQRTGSSWLMDLLNNLEGGECHGELFLPEPVETKPIAGCSEYDRYIERKKQHVSGVRPFSVFSYLNGLYGRNGIVGFRLMYSQLKKYPEILVYLMMKRLKIVHLVRENVLDLVISRKVAEKSGRSHDTAGGDKTKDTRVYLDPGETVARIEDLENNVRFMDRFLGTVRFPRTRITYEELVADPDSFARVAAFLSLDAPGGLPDSNLVKRQRKPHSESIQNYAEIEKALRASGYDRLL